MTILETFTIRLRDGRTVDVEGVGLSDDWALAHHADRPSEWGTLHIPSGMKAGSFSRATALAIVPTLTPPPALPTFIAGKTPPDALAWVMSVIQAASEHDAARAAASGLKLFRVKVTRTAEDQVYVMATSTEDAQDRALNAGDDYYDFTNEDLSAYSWTVARGTKVSKYSLEDAVLAPPEYGHLRLEDAAKVLGLNLTVQGEP